MVGAQYIVDECMGSRKLQSTFHTPGIVLIGNKNEADRCLAHLDYKQPRSGGHVDVCCRSCLKTTRSLTFHFYEPIHGAEKITPNSVVGELNKNAFPT